MMWVQKNKTGNFQFVERYKDPLTGKYRKVSVTYDANNRVTRKRAQMVLEEKIQDKLRHVQDGNIKQGVTLGEVMEEWEPIYKQTIKYDTWRLYVSIKKNIQKYIGEDKLVAQITPKYLISTYEDMLYKHDRTNSIVEKTKIFMNIILKYAYKKNYTTQPPAHRLDISWKKDTTKSTENKFLEDDELEAVLKEARKHNERYADIFELQYLTGMRMGEALALQPKNIKHEGKHYYIQVNGTLIYASLKIADYYKQSTPKTESSVREVLLPDRAVEIVKKWSNGKKPSDFLFSINGRLFNPPTLNRLLKTIKSDLNLHKKLTTHTFRHTNISKLAEMGVPLYIIQERVGHADERITQQIYLHVTNKAKKKYDDIISNLK